MTNNIHRKLFSGLFWILLLNIIVKPLWLLGIEVGVQNAVGTETYGFYFSIFNLAYIFNILLDFGITNHNTRASAQRPQRIEQRLMPLLSIKVALLALYMVITFGVALLIGYQSREFHLLLLLCVNQFLNSLLLFVRSNFEGLLLFRWDSVLSVLDRLLMIVICGALLYVCATGDTQFRIEWFVYAQMAAYLIALLVALWVLLHKVHVQRKPLRWRFLRTALLSSAPFALLVLLMASYNRIDPILLSLLAPNGHEATGIYAAAFRLLDAITMIAYLVSVPLLPVFAKQTHQLSSAADAETHSALAFTVRSSFNLLFIFSVAVAITFSFLSTPLMQLLYDNNIETTAQVFAVLIYGIIPISMTYIFGTLLTAGGKLKTLNLLALATLIINIVVNALLIPRLGALGSAWASLVAQSFMGITQLLLSLHIYRLRPTIQYIMTLVAYIAIITLLNITMAYLHVAWWWHIIIVGITSILIAFYKGRGKWFPLE